MSYILQRIAAIAYIVVTSIALGYALTAHEPAYENPIIFYAYGMMAPYQGYETYNQDLLVEGLHNDVWEEIDLKQYMPFLKAERIVRSYLFAYRLQNNPDLRMERYSQIARRIQELEAKQGRIYSDIRLHWRTWPMSEDGFAARQSEADLEFLVHIP